jgi:hypothetical protein
MGVWQRHLPKTTLPKFEADIILHKWRLCPYERAALRLLAGEPEGVIEAMMLAHGFRVELLVDLCIAGLATAKPEQMHAGGRTMEVVRMKITEAGRQVLTGKDSP